jgi:hypothetical protein
MAPLIAALVSKGLGALADALVKKGKAWVEEKTGVEIPDSPDQLTGEKLTELKQAEMQHEEVLIAAALEGQRIEADLDKHAGSQVTERWKADMASDSWLSKNIRPLALVTLLVLLTAVLIADACGAVFDDTSIKLLDTCLQIVLAAYFLGRTIEKGVSIWQGRKGRVAGK